MKKMFNGFTLAETLITIAVIAIIAALTMPALQHLQPNKEQVMLKKAYYLIGRNVTELINDDEFYPDTGVKTTSGFSNANRINYRGVNYGSILNDEGNYTDEAAANQKFCKLFAARMNLQDIADNDICKTTVTLAENFKKGKKPSGAHFTTADGIIWILPIGDFNRGAAEDADSNMSIYIDVNGDKKPNCFAQTAAIHSNNLTNYICSKTNDAPDRFEIKVDRYGKLTVPDNISKLYLRRTDTSKTYTQVINDEKQKQKVTDIKNLK